MGRWEQITNLRDHILAWLDSIGADGLMMPDSSGFLYKKGHLERIAHDTELLYYVPAFRHADGTYHTEPKHWFLCKTCICDCMPIGDDACNARFDAHECTPYQSWLSHKEATK